MTITKDTASAEAQASSREEQAASLGDFLKRLKRMSPEQRISASSGTFDLRERTIYAAHYPDEVPKVNGELPWIALTLE